MIALSVVEREIVEHDVAGGEAEFAPCVAGERLDHVLADEIDFDVGLRLRIGEQHDLERVRLLLAVQAGNRRDAGSGPVGAMPSKVKVRASGRAVGLMNGDRSAADPVSGSIGGMKPAGLMTIDVAGVRQRQRRSALPRRSRRRRGRWTPITSASPGLAGPGLARAVPVLEHESRKQFVASARAGAMPASAARRRPWYRSSPRGA